MTELGAELFKVRKSLGLSLREAGKKIDLSHNYIRKLEKGFDPQTKKDVKPSVETLKRIAMGYDIDFDRLMQLANFTLPSVEDDAPLIKVPIYKNIVDMRLSAVTSDFRMYKQDTVSKNAMLLEVSDSTLNTFKAISLLLLEPFQGVLNNELALFIIDNKMIIGCMHMDNDGKQIIQRIDSKNEQIIYQDKLEIWRIVEIIHLVGQGESKGI